MGDTTEYKPNESRVTSAFNNGTQEESYFKTRPVVSQIENDENNDDTYHTEYEGAMNTESLEQRF